jgi:UDP-N-acetylmuramoyl-tripeptide--D-alanyl-D-alanine ligase
MRFKPVPLPNGALAINDAYNANPQSMRASLDTLAAMDGRRVAVLGDMLELGDGEAALHQELVAHACSLGLDLVALVGPRMTSASAGTGALAAEDGVTLAPQIAAFLKPGDRVLFKGSRGARVERVLDAVVDALKTEAS